MKTFLLTGNLHFAAAPPVTKVADTEEMLPFFYEYDKLVVGMEQPISPFLYCTWLGYCLLYAYIRANNVPIKQIYTLASVNKNTIKE